MDGSYQTLEWALVLNVQETLRLKFEVLNPVYSADTRKYHSLSEEKSIKF